MTYIKNIFTEKEVIRHNRPRSDASTAPRILMLVENQGYPDDIRVRQEATTLSDAGYQVSVICQRVDGQPFTEIVNDVYVYRYPAPVAADSFRGYLLEYGYSLVASFVLSLYVALRHGINVIHAHNPPDLYVFIGLFYKLFGVKFIFDHHDLAPENYFARFPDGGNQTVYRVLVWLEALSCKVADHVIATNESYKAIQVERAQIPAERVTVVRNGPNLARLHIVEPDQTLQSRAATLIGYIGTMGPQDGLDYLLRIAHHLIHDLGRTDFYFIVIGTGSEWERLQVMRDELGLEEYVWFTGKVSDEELCRYLSSVDICVSVDPHNDFTDHCTMIKMMEYMTFAKPIVAFDLKEHRVTAERAAIYVSNNDELEFARVLTMLMDDPKTREKMGAFGRKRVETEINWENSARELLDAYEKVLPLNKAEGFGVVAN